jgi:hypothetical protein
MTITIAAMIVDFLRKPAVRLDLRRSMVEWVNVGLSGGESE